MEKIVIMAQTPPPFHGQSVMQKYLVDVKWDWCEKEHIRLDYSKSIREVASFNFGKIFKLVKIISKIVVSRMRKPIAILYYPPAGPYRVPLYRDICTLLFAKMFARRIVLHFHAGGLTELINRLTWAERFFARLAFKGVDGAVVLLPWLKTEVEWFKPKKTFVVPNGIEDVIKRNILREKPVATVILFVGNLKEEKGIFVLLEAATKLKEKGKAFQIRIMGETHSDEVLQSIQYYVSRHFLTENIILLGGRTGEEKWKEFHDAHIFCLPTYATEAMPVSILEAMMFSLPVVTTNWRAIPDMITDNEQGLLAEVKSAQSLADKLTFLIDDSDRAAGMGQEGRARFVQMFSIENHLHMMSEVFKSGLIKKTK
ncbi:MAG: glycosyltransferase family 4 protein [Chitinophagaceae bacterium]|nr:glycosyltransferase family 4 protein [Chitinophagaceae bacterium]